MKRLIQSTYVCSVRMLQSLRPILSRMWSSNREPAEVSMSGNARRIQCVLMQATAVILGCFFVSGYGPNG